MKNPVVSIREGLGISRRRLSLLLGVSYGVLAQTELGYPLTLPESISSGLERLGFDRERAEQEYRAWHLGLLRSQENTARRGA